MFKFYHARTALYGAYRLAMTDIAGMSYFDRSITGFWRSFYAAGLVAPLFITLLIIRFNTHDINVPAFRFYSTEVIAYVIGWVLFPLVVFHLIQALNKEEHYIGFVVAYNWASVLQNGVYLPFAILFQLGIISGGIAGFLNLILLGLVLGYTWFIAKTALNISGTVASGIVILDVGLWITLNILTESFIRTST